jgi:hypothetical protein
MFLEKIWAVAEVVSGAKRERRAPRIGMFSALAANTIRPAVSAD